MTVYVQREVQEARDSPSAGATATLLLGIDGSQKQVRERVNSLGGEVVEELPFDTLRVEIPEEGIADLCDSVDIESIEYDAEGEVLSQGN